MKCQMARLCATRPNWAASLGLPQLQGYVAEPIYIAFPEKYVKKKFFFFFKVLFS